MDQVWTLSYGWMRFRVMAGHSKNDFAPLFVVVKALIFFVFQFGTVAQLVEQRTENPCVGGSIPPGPTILKSLA